MNHDRWFVRQGEVIRIHPLAALDLHTLQKEAMERKGLAFTPSDLWETRTWVLEVLDDLIRAGDFNALAIREQLSTSFFDTSTSHRITLGKVKEYEMRMKGALQHLANAFPYKAKLLLDRARLVEYVVGERVRTPEGLGSVISCQPDLMYQVHLDGDGVNGSIKEFAQSMLEPAPSSYQKTAAPDLDLFKLLRNNLKPNPKFLPAVIFQLDTLRCMTMFQKLLSEIEEAEAAEFPDYYQKIQERNAKVAKKREEICQTIASLEQTLSQQVKTKDTRTAADREKMVHRLNELREELTRHQFQDETKPHEQFTYVPLSKQLARSDYESIIQDVSGADTEGRRTFEHKMPANHPFLRALRRGIGIYIENGIHSYRQHVQRLAQEGKLAVVFSDSSLAYGVNMPFSSCIFAGDCLQLSPLLAAQMTGRAGRRGLKSGAHLIFGGMYFFRIRELAQAHIPAIQGKKPIFPTIALSGKLSQRDYPAQPITHRRLEHITTKWKGNHYEFLGHPFFKGVGSNSFFSNTCNFVP